MKNSKLYSLILIFAVALLSIQCTTDPIEGPPGENGVDGVDGIDGVDGVSGTAECVECHNVAKSEEVHASYLFSGHAIDADHNNDGTPLSYYANRVIAPGPLACAACHTSDGYVDYAETGTTLIGGDKGLYPGTQTITCTTCHGKHTTFDFEKDGFDYALRSIAPVDFIASDFTLDYGEEFTSHTCASCHQPRSTFEGAINPDGTVRVTGRFGPHYGAQSTLLEGIQGAELDGYEYRSTDGTAAHRAGFPGVPSSCVECHMGPSSGNVDGLHTKKPTETSCLNCHKDGSPSKEFLKEDFQALEDLLVAKGVIEYDENGEVDIITNDNMDLIPAAALWNYKMIYYDHSHGVHNPKYAKDLVQNSIDALNGY